MGERKPLNKYYPADLDPSRKLPRVGKKNDPDKAKPVRMMLPFSIRCKTCGEFMGAGTKCNAMKEDAKMNYLKVKRFRFRFKCSACKTFITMLTDPKNAGYEMETNATANFSMAAEMKSAREEAAREKEEKKKDTMAQLEDRTLDSKREMDALDQLENLQQRNRARAKVSADNALEMLAQQLESRVEDEQGGDDDGDDDIDEEELVRQALAQKEKRLKELAEEEVDNDDDDEKFVGAEDEKKDVKASEMPATTIVVTKKRKRDKKDKKKKKKKKKKEDPSSVLAIGYGSSSGEEE